MKPKLAFQSPTYWLGTQIISFSDNYQKTIYDFEKKNWFSHKWTRSRAYQPRYVCTYLGMYVCRYVDALKGRGLSASYLLCLASEHILLNNLKYLIYFALEGVTLTRTNTITINLFEFRALKVLRVHTTPALTKGFIQIWKPFKDNDLVVFVCCKINLFLYCEAIENCHKNTCSNLV